jgi:prepilin-type N-terminal cleavage/methylation domain-containing protein
VTGTTTRQAFVADALRRRARHLAGGDRVRDDSGMTLVELLIASSLLVVLLTIVLITYTTFLNIGTEVFAQNSEFDQLSPAINAVQPLLRSEVEPGPSGNPDNAGGGPIPGFGVDALTKASQNISEIGNFSLTFYANVGTLGGVNACPTGTSTVCGPAKLVAGETTPDGTATSTCSTTDPCNFQVKEYLPTQSSPGVSTCPFTLTSTAVCQYGSSYRLIDNVSGVVNDPSHVNASGAVDQNIFTYDIFDPTIDATLALTPAEVTSGSISVTGTPFATDVSGTSALSLATCTAPTPTYLDVAASCPADAIQSVAIDLVVDQKGSGTNGSTETQVITYRDQGNSLAPHLPFQYSTSVG